MIYFDNAATTYPKPKCVYDFADKFYRDYGVYQSRGNYSLSQKVNELIVETRKLVSSLFNSPQDFATVFTPSATIAINMVLQGYEFKSGMNVYTTHFEHNAVIRCLEHIKEKIDINIIKLYTNHSDLLYNISKIKEQFVECPPDVVIVNHASNVFGNVAPVSDIFNLAKEYEATTILDCSQTAGLIKLDLRKCKSDFTVFAGHKTLYSPFGVAGFVMNKNLCIKPLIYGGTGFNSADTKMPDTYPERLEAGSVDTYAIAGLNRSLKWIREIGINNIYSKEMELLDYLHESLTKLNNVITYTPSAQKLGIVSFNVKGYSSDEVGQILCSNGIAVRTGLHCAPEAHKFKGTFPSGTVRVGLSFFNSKSDIEQLVKVLKLL